MTISSNTRQAGPFTGNGTASTFAFTFKVFSEADLVVIKTTTATGTDSTLTITTDYTVSLNENQNTSPGGSITLTAGALASGYKLTITSDIDNQQLVDLTNQGGFYPSVINDALDRATIQIQQVDNAVERSVKFPISDGSSGDILLPAIDARKGTVLAFNETTGLPEAGPDIASVTSVAGNTAAINTVAGEIDPTNNIATLAGIAGDISTVAGIDSDVTTVAGIDSDVTAVAADATDIGTVAGSIGNVNTVAGISANVTTVAGINANVTTVAGISGDVTTVAGIGSDVSAVAAINSDVTAVAADATDIGTVSSNIANVNTVAGISANVTTVAGISANVTSVAGNATNINTVAGIDSNVSTVAGIAADVTAVANNEVNVSQVATDIAKVIEVANDLQEVVSEIDTVANNIANVNTVGTAIADVSAVAAIDSNVTTVSGISANVTTVAGVSANVTTVAGISANVTTVAGISADVTTVAGDAADIATVAGISADVSAVAAIDSDITTAAANVTDITNFADVYIGASATAPTTRADSSALQVGDLYFDTSTDTMKVYSSGGWTAAGSSVNGTANRYDYVVGTSSGSYTGSTTNFPATYDAGYVDVFLNGTKLVPTTDFTATSGTEIVLGTAASSGSNVCIVGYGTFNIATFSIGDATDVNLLGIGNGDVLAYNSTSGSFEAGSVDAASSVTYENLNANGDVGTGSSQVASGNHNHTGTYQPYDANLPAWPSTVDATEVGYLNGVTSSIQTQLNGKASTASIPTTLPNSFSATATEGYIKNVSGTVSIYASGAWRQIYPAVYS
jgi:hypothetical protein